MCIRKTFFRKGGRRKLGIDVWADSGISTGHSDLLDRIICVRTMELTTLEFEMSMMELSSPKSLRNEV